MSLSHRLAVFTKHGLLGRLDVEFVRLLMRQGFQVEPEAAIAIAFASRAPQLGHVCAPVGALKTLSRQELDVDLEKLPWPDAALALKQLRGLDCVREPSRGDERATPLVLVDDRLYLDRMYLDECAVADAIKARLVGVRTLSADEAADARATLKKLFDHPKYEPNEEQMRAAATALLRDFTVITGGPGTGKTTTVTRVLASWLARESELRIKLVAPTARAAAHLAESIQREVSTLRGRFPDDLLDAIPTEASTIHRALGTIPNRARTFRHNAQSPLPTDALVVDETSMVDISLLARLLEALTEDTRVVLLGDRDQLASVAAGAALADLCGPRSRVAQTAQMAKLSPDFAKRLGALVDVPEQLIANTAVPAISDAVVRLETSHRFPADSPLGELAAAINSADVDGIESVFRRAAGDANSPLRLVEPTPDGALPRAILQSIVDAFDGVQRSPDPSSALEKLNELRVLCAVREGGLGVGPVNERVGRALARRLGQDPAQPFRHGVVVMVTQNDYGVRLFNGDIGLLLKQPGQGGRIHVFFKNGSEEPRSLSPSRLPPHETAFAMTIHKSQGSEFQKVVVLLPAKPSPILTAELIYTAITRSKSHVTIVGRLDTLLAAITQRITRGSGLEAALWDVSGATPRGE